MITLMEALQRNSLLAILRAREPGPLLEVAEVLIDAGVRCLEIPLPTPGSLEAVRELGSSSDVLVGVGTVMSPEEVVRSADAGAAFVVSPNFDPVVVRAAGAAGLGSLPGAFTPTEAVAAWREGSSAVKLFPASIVGPEFVSAMRGSLPELPLVPTGGVRLEDVSAYLSAGAVAVAVGGPLVGDALQGGSLDELRARAEAFVARARESGISRQGG
ncbi:MAG TPA: bifunctional 4-hydroxy-2-oxoglutarate aldolase/2-dehydro-3-deoxy-phosphogluconate aldolase [Pseudonocardiaceae bacterium]|nr:bifunctional 4-hydroxy-2-oxoglutarate aldolase/2-dehydro-3-deoxy-phosphogluconate aldolase [Pseudonocardiaceae bacterium]